MDSSKSIESSIQAVTNLDIISQTDLKQINDNTVSLGLLPSTTNDATNKEQGSAGENSVLEQSVEVEQPINESTPTEQSTTTEPSSITPEEQKTPEAVITEPVVPQSTQQVLDPVTQIITADTQRQQIIQQINDYLIQQTNPANTQQIGQLADQILPAPSVASYIPPVMAPSQIVQPELNQQINDLIPEAPVVDVDISSYLVPDLGIQNVEEEKKQSEYQSTSIFDTIWGSSTQSTPQPTNEALNEESEQIDSSSYQATKEEDNQIISSSPTYGRNINSQGIIGSNHPGQASTVPLSQIPGQQQVDSGYSMTQVFVYITVMFMIGQYVRNNYFSQQSPQKKFGFGDKLLGAAGVPQQSCAQEASQPLRPIPEKEQKKSSKKDKDSKKKKSRKNGSEKKDGEEDEDDDTFDKV